MSYWRLFYHVVWSTFERQPCIDPGWEKEIYGYIWGKATALDCIPQAINGMPDHIHVVLSIPPRLSISDAVGKLKGSSSHHINLTFPGVKFAWQKEYRIFSISETGLSRVVEYVKAQKHHHRDQTLIAQLEKIVEI